MRWYKRLLLWCFQVPGLVIVPGIGHSMNLESPPLYAGYFGAWFGGLAT